MTRALLEALAELADRGVLVEARKAQARRRTGQYHRVTKSVEAKSRTKEDLMAQIAAAGHAGSGDPAGA